MKDLLYAFHELTGRNVIAYYGDVADSSILNADYAEYDRNGLMQVIQDMDKSAGLDLILHEPIAHFERAEAIARYLKEEFGTRIRAIIPEKVVGGGTLIACSAGEILMSESAVLGSVEAYINLGTDIVSGPLIVNNYERTKGGYEAGKIELEDAAEKLSRIPKGGYKASQKAGKLRERVVYEKLGNGILAGKPDDCITPIAELISNSHDTTGKSSFFTYAACSEHGMPVEKLVEGSDEQRLISQIHEKLLEEFQNKKVRKLIMNHMGNQLKYEE